MNRPGVRFLGVIAFQILILSSVIGFKQYTVWTGDTVVLKVQPIDPTSLFQGDYVRLSYDISSLDRSLFRDNQGRGPGATVWVELAKGEDGFWHAVAASTDKQRVPGDHVQLKGKVESPFTGNRTGALRVRYGVEEVFVPEESGRAVERSREQLGVEVKVDRFGNAVARRILVDGQPFKLKAR